MSVMEKSVNYKKSQDIYFPEINVRAFLVIKFDLNLVISSEAVDTFFRKKEGWIEILNELEGKERGCIVVTYKTSGHLQSPASLNPSSGKEQSGFRKKGQGMFICNAYFIYKGNSKCFTKALR